MMDFKLLVTCKPYEVFLVEFFYLFIYLLGRVCKLCLDLVKINTLTTCFLALCEHQTLVFMRPLTEKSVIPTVQYSTYLPVQR